MTNNKKKNRTTQFVDMEQPLLDEASLAVKIACGKCGTGRLFIITENLKIVARRNGRGLAIHTFCEKCKHPIQSEILWIKEEKTYSYKDNKVNIGEGYAVQDTNGLGELK